jgi:hypothetical protein
VAAAATPTRLARAARRAASEAARPRGAAALAGVLALALYLFGPPGGDAAAHLYQTQVWRDQGWELWDNFWYSGRYAQVNYSLSYYPLAALLGTATVVAGSAAAAAGAFAAIVRRQWPALATGPVLAFALVGPLGVVAGTYPFQLGMAFALGALASLGAGRAGWTFALIVLTGLAHPLALLFALVVLGAVALTSGRWWREPRWRWLAAGAVAVGAAQGLLMRAFASDGARYPFSPQAALAIALFCGAGVLLTRGIHGQRQLRALFLAYGAVAAAAFLISSPLGGNVERLILLMGTPLLLLPLAARRFRPRGIALACVAAALAWQAFPAVAGWSTASAARANQEEYWYPVIAFLDQHPDPNHRVEVVATADNWEAFHLARRGVPLARGWFRQDDFPGNAVLYEPLTPRGYQAWLRRVGVRYVFLPDDPLDYSGRNEAELLESGDSGLDLVARIGGWTVYELPDPTPIATPAGRQAHGPDAVEVLGMTQDTITLRVAGPGRYRLRLSYTPYWRVVRGLACVGPATPSGTELRTVGAGVIKLRFAVRLGKIVGAVLGSEHTCGTPPKGATAPES